jgi:uncharacterized protein GlcG (DUF336 family)
VVDDRGWPILLLRMNNAAYIASVGSRKARTAALFKKPSQSADCRRRPRDWGVSILRSTTARSRKPGSRHSQIKSSRQSVMRHIAGIDHKEIVHVARE